MNEILTKMAFESPKHNDSLLEELSLSSYQKGLSAADLGHYNSKLTLSNGHQLPDPYSIDQVLWTNDPINLPDVMWQDITTYLLDTPSSFTKDSIKAYRSLEAYNYFISGHVQDCYYYKVTDEFCYIKAKVGLIQYNWCSLCPLLNVSFELYSGLNYYYCDYLLLLTIIFDVCKKC